VSTAPLAGAEAALEGQLKEKAFAPGVNREEVYGAEAVLGLSLDEFVAVAIDGLQQVAPDIGL
jgi:predicted hydrolase (HD superfamily)